MKAFLLKIHGGSYDDAWEEDLGIFSDKDKAQLLVDEFNWIYPMAELVEVELDSDEEALKRFHEYKRGCESQVRAYWKDLTAKQRNKEKRKCIEFICDRCEVSEKFVMDTLKLTEEKK